jgi:hypothetical protein
MTANEIKEFVGKIKFVYLLQIKIKVMIQSATIQAVVNQVNDSVSSIFTKEDVLKLIEGMQQGIDREKELLVEQEVEAVIKASSSNQVVLTQDQISALSDKIYDDIDRQLDQIRSDDVVDYDSAEFSIDYNNRVVLDDVDIDTSSILRKVTERTREVIENFIEDISLPVKVVLEVE